MKGKKKAKALAKEDSDSGSDSESDGEGPDKKKKKKKGKKPPAEEELAQKGKKDGPPSPGDVMGECDGDGSGGISLEEAHACFDAHHPSDMSEGEIEAAH